MAGIAPVAVASILAALVVTGCASTPTGAPAGDRFAAAQSYVEDLVRAKSGDAGLAQRLGGDARKAWQTVLTQKRERRTTAQIAQAVRAAGLNAVLVRKGSNRFEIPSGTVTALLMDVEGGCRQIYEERWVASRADGPTLVAAVGIGLQDVEQRAVAEKKIQLIAFELPKRGDYLDITTNSLSPFGKVILVGGVVLLVGCDDEERPAQITVTAAFTPPPNPEETPNPQPSQNQPAKKGEWNTDAAQIAINGEVELTWRSYIQSLTASLTPVDKGVPNSVVQIWLTNADRMAITRLEPAGKISDDGLRASTTTDGEGKIKVTLRQRNAFGQTSSDLWGFDPGANPGDARRRRVKVTVDTM